MKAVIVEKPGDEHPESLRPLGEREKIEEQKWKRVAVYGLDFILAVRDYRELQQGAFELVGFDFQFDMARAVKSEEELRAVRDAMDIILDGFVGSGTTALAAGGDLF